MTSSRLIWDLRANYGVKSTKFENLHVAYYFKPFMLDEWEVRSYTIISSLLCFGGNWLYDKGWFRLGEEVHRPRNLREWRNMIDYKMSSSLGGRYCQDFSYGEFEAWIKKMIWLSIWQTLFARRLFQRTISNPMTRNLTFAELQLETFVYLFFHFVRHTNHCLYP